MIEKLDIPRRQVFVEAVIMEVNLDHTTDFGVSLHQGFHASPQGESTYRGQTKYSTIWTPALCLCGKPGWLRRLPRWHSRSRNPGAPVFGSEHSLVRCHPARAPAEALISTSPIHAASLLTSDSGEAEITVGQKAYPFQAGYPPMLAG